MPYPFHCATTGAGDSIQYENFPIQPQADFSNLKRPQNANDAAHLLGVALRTTRRDIVEEKCNAWKESAKPKKRRIPPIERRRIGENEAATTILHFLYRLRIRSNYGDSELFVSGPSVIDSIAFATAYVAVADYFLGALEVMLGNRLGMNHVLEDARGFYRQFRDAKPPVFKRWAET